MSDEINSEMRASRRPEMVQRSSGRSLTVLASLAALAMIVAAGVFLWFNFDRLALASSTQEPPPPPAAAEDTALLKEIQSLQQQTASEVDSLKQSVATQQSDLSRISDQLSALASRVDTLQNPPPPPPPVAARPVAPSVRMAAKKPGRPPSGPVGPISVGGAPLHSAPESERR